MTPLAPRTPYTAVAEASLSTLTFFTSFGSSMLKAVELMRSPVTNISNALVGRIAGMAAVQKTGEAGFEESTIRAGRRRSILEHVDVLHIVRVEHVEGRHVAHDAVDDDQPSGSCRARS